MRRLTEYYKGLTMTTTQIKRLAKRVAASTDKAEQRDIRTKQLQLRRDYVTLLNTVYVIEQLFYVARADRDVQPALEIALRNLFRDRNRLRDEGLRDGLFSETIKSAPWLDECNGDRWATLTA